MLEYAYLYFNFNYRFIPPVPINSFVFIFISSFGVFIGFSIGFFGKLFIDETDDGKSENFDIEVLSHPDNLESHEKLLKKYINNIIYLKQYPTYDDVNKKIYQKVGFDDIFLLYVISKNVFAILIFFKKGRYIYQNEKSNDIQKNISFLLKNSLNFKDANEEERIKAKESCIDLLSQYEINNITVYIGTHKKETIATIFIITIVWIVYTFYPFDIILQAIKNIVNTIVVPQIITILVTAIVFWFISKKNK